MIYVFTHQAHLYLHVPQTHFFWFTNCSSKPKLAKLSGFVKYVDLKKRFLWEVTKMGTETLQNKH